MAPPEDSLEGIYGTYHDIARNSKFAGGIGTPWGSIRSESSLIKGTNGKSNGIVPWLNTLNVSVAGAIGRCTSQGLLKMMNLERNPTELTIEKAASRTAMDVNYGA